MPDGMEVLSQKVEDLTMAVTRVDINTQKMSWVLSDPDVGLVRQVRELATVVGGLKETDQDHETRIKAIQSRHDTQDKTAAELRQPAIASFFSLVEKLLFLVISVALGWLWAIKK